MVINKIIAWIIWNGVTVHTIIATLFKRDFAAIKPYRLLPGSPKEICGSLTRTRFEKSGSLSPWDTVTVKSQKLFTVHTVRSIRFAQGKLIGRLERWIKLQIVYRPLSCIKPYERNPRKNKDAVPAVRESIRQFGFKIPIVIDNKNTIICGHTRVLAAKELGMTEVPCVVADELERCADQSLPSCGQQGRRTGLVGHGLAAAGTGRHPDAHDRLRL